MPSMCEKVPNRESVPNQKHIESLNPKWWVSTWWIYHTLHFKKKHLFIILKNKSKFLRVSNSRSLFGFHCHPWKVLANWSRNIRREPQHTLSIPKINPKMKGVPFINCLKQGVLGYVPGVCWKNFLVGAFNPFEKYARQNRFIFPK